MGASKENLNFSFFPKITWVPAKFEFEFELRIEKI